MTYRVIVRNSPGDLEDEINRLKAQGWREQGGLAISTPFSLRVNIRRIFGDVQANYLIFGQAMTK